MSYKIKWVVENRVLYEKTWGTQSLEEIREAAAKLDKLISEGTAPVHFILDTRELKRVPLNMAALRENLVMLRNPDLEWIVHIEAQHPIVRFLVEMLAKTFHIQLHSVRTYDEAIYFLYQTDPTMETYDPDSNLSPHNNE